MNMRWKYQQDTPEGRWTSTEVFEGDTRAAVQGVIAGHLLGQPRAAIEEGTGRVVYALDAHGNATAAAAKLFDSVQQAEEARSEGASCGTASTQVPGHEAAMVSRQRPRPR
jgi:hypothetical protein